MERGTDWMKAEQRSDERHRKMVYEIKAMIKEECLGEVEHALIGALRSLALDADSLDFQGGADLARFYTQKADAVEAM